MSASTLKRSGTQSSQMRVRGARGSGSPSGPTQPAAALVDGQAGWCRSSRPRLSIGRPSCGRSGRPFRSIRGSRYGPGQEPVVK